MAFTPSLNIDWEPLFLSTLRDFSQILGRLVWFPGWNCNTNGAECLVAADKPVNRVSGSPGKHESARPWHPWHWGSRGNLTSSRSQHRASSKPCRYGEVGGAGSWLVSKGWGGPARVSPRSPHNHTPPFPAESVQPFRLWPQRVEFNDLGTNFLLVLVN